MAPVDWSLEALDNWIRKNLRSEWHPVGTCRMSTDPAAVIDSATMSVNGVQGLYVADTSVMPTIPRANTHAPTIMVAERGADLIQGHARY
jgi:choline dehydrogenase